MGTTLQLPDIAILVFFGHISFSISCHKICLSAPVLILNKTEGEKLFALSQEFPPPPEGEFVHFCDNTVWVRKVQREFFCETFNCFKYGIRQWCTFFKTVYCCTTNIIMRWCAKFDKYEAIRRTWFPLEWHLIQGSFVLLSTSFSIFDICCINQLAILESETSEEFQTLQFTIFILHIKNLHHLLFFRIIHSISTNLTLRVNIFFERNKTSSNSVIHIYLGLSCHSVLLEEASSVSCQQECESTGYYKCMSGLVITLDKVCW